VDEANEKAYKQAERKLTALMAEIDRQRGTPEHDDLGYVIDEWLRTAEIEGSTC
jgi:integrase